MPRIKYPPTPATSTGPIAEEKLSDMESAFALPPAAVNRSPPASPILQRKRTLSNAAKSKEELPPPPSRARKIIQMKPKEENSSQSPASSSKPSSPKRKQPSATSAAGRKIARKTAHSIIERRRRSKMNEEFGVLKDMIPACKGVEMHKLAILQAGIEYVRYLQGCVEKLRDGQGMPVDQQPRRTEAVQQDDEEMEESSDEDNYPPQSKGTERTLDLKSVPSAEATVSKPTTITSAHPSPAMKPVPSSSSLVNQRTLPPLTSTTYSTSPPVASTWTPLHTGISPAFQAIQFNPDINRTFSRHSSTGSTSPNILPLPKAAMSLLPVTLGQQSMTDGHAEATATAALMMMTTDRRLMEGGSNSSGRNGMSVKDLLSN